MTVTGPGRAQYTEQLKRVRGEILMLGSMVAKSIERSTRALGERDVRVAEQVVDDDRRIDDLTYDLEDRILMLIATQQPMASDLRGLAAEMFIISELERMGDYAEGIAKIAIAAASEPPLKPLIDLPRMAVIATEMLHQSLEAFVEQDFAACQAIWRRDDEVDQLYEQVYRELLSYMLSSPGTTERATQLLWAAHNMERIADRVTNICERTAFVITGNPRALPGDV